MLKLLVKCDYPISDKIVSISGDSTLEALRKELSTSLQLDAASAQDYRFISVEFGKDVVELNQDASTKLSSIPIADRSTLCLVAPAGIKPEVRQKKAKEEKTEGETDKYKEYTIDNALTKLQTIVNNAAKRKIALEFIDIWMKSIVQSKKWLDLPKATVIELLKRNTLRIPEVDLFTGVVEWGKAECKRNDTVPEIENLKTTLSEMIPLIRFGCMSTGDLAMGVTSTGLLDGTQVLELFTYLGLKTSGLQELKPGASIKDFNFNPRIGRKPPQWFKFTAKAKHASLVIDENRQAITSNTTSYYQSCFADTILSDAGIYEWDIKINTMQANTYSLCIGVVPADCIDSASSKMVGYSGHLPGWAYCAGNGQFFDGAMTAFGRMAKAGETVSVKLDASKSTTAASLEYFINGVSLGVATEKVKFPVKPALSLYGHASVELKFAN